jgi:hypothetical protein
VVTLPGTKVIQRVYTPAKADTRIAGLEGELGHLEDWTIPRLRDRVKGVEDSLTHAWQRIRGRTVVLGLAAVAGAVAVALTHLGLNWITCRNWKRIGRDVCRLPTHWISDLLALVADFFVLETICQAIPLLERAFSDIAAPFVETLTTASAKICSPKSAWAKPLQVPTLNTPEQPSLTLHLP